MASPSEHLYAWMKRRWQASADYRSALPQRFLNAIALRNPATKALFWINFILPAGYALFIKYIEGWVRDATVIRTSDPLGLSHGTLAPMSYAETPLNYYMFYFFPLELLGLAFVLVQALNIRCIRRYKTHRRWFWGILVLNFVALPLGQCGFLLVLTILPFYLLVYLVYLAYGYDSYFF